MQLEYGFDSGLGRRCQQCLCYHGLTCATAVRLYVFGLDVWARVSRESHACKPVNNDTRHQSLTRLSQVCATGCAVAA